MDDVGAVSQMELSEQLGLLGFTTGKTVCPANCIVEAEADCDLE